MPVGAVWPEEAVSVTVTVHVVGWLTATALGAQLTDVVVGLIPTAIVAMPELVRCVESPM
jgi:hypothetical protein